MRFGSVWQVGVSSGLDDEDPPTVALKDVCEVQNLDYPEADVRDCTRTVRCYGILKQTAR